MHSPVDRPYQRLQLLLAAVGIAGVVATAAEGSSRQPIPAQFTQAEMFSKPIDEAAKSGLARRKLSGITVPHHLLAARLIAQAFQSIESRRIKKVIVVFPDHFKRSNLPFATTDRPFDTVFGRVEISLPDVRTLLGARRLVARSDLFERDHGIGAIVPFVRHYLPDARIVPIAVSLRSQQVDWDQLVAVLHSIVSDDTLVVQSTDFSHYLPLEQAMQRDQEVLNVLASGDLASVARLRQPQHMDSRGSQYLQMRIQQEFFKSRPLIVYNSNSHAFADGRNGLTTTYIVQFYESDPSMQIGQDLPGSKVFCFAGDTFFGRGLLRVLSTRDEQQRFLREARSVLNGCRLIVNLTGVIVPEIPLKLEPMMLAMPSILTLEALKAMNIVGVSLANNHAMDLGSAAFDQMKGILSDAHITTLTQGQIVDFGGFRLTALTDLDNQSLRSEGVIGSDDIARLAASHAKPPVFAMINWGSDYVNRPDPRQIELRSELRQSAISLVIGVHPHFAALDLDLLEGGEGISVHSLGNFIFDQTSRVASGSILEVRVFTQGTYFVRLVPHRNFFEAALQQR
ncbi:AmmeMemoRadiSam system protein B [Bradyrhizobium tropiciagri]|uniref:AmmeMemoRadiSam system protein B n=1 Tax=Bradyrhizobium tropiciagri TaxID=312253 RepID=UPI001BADEF95|nr:AmmeMemoRadiSam system protein B [Bradyrhizobium tropiciagri]MBR0900277.1 AmmeMemoRadiSam system protein B [Bradyrhizobium tropiciagri]